MAWKSWALALLALALCAESLRAQPVWDNGASVSYVGWASQNGKSYGFDAQTADDFVLPTGPGGQTVWLLTGVNWVGEYLNMFATSPPINFHYAFDVIIYTDNGSGNEPPGGPNDPTALAIFKEFLTNDLVNETPLGNPTQNAAQYSYSASLSNSLYLSASTKYWISIQAQGDFPPEWLWGQSVQQNLHTGVIGFPSNFINFWTGLPDAGASGPTDMAFQLFATPAPEPASLVLLAAAVAMVGRRRPRRR